MRIQELCETDLGDDGATIRLREILRKIIERENLDTTQEVTFDFRAKLFREAYLLPPFNTRYCLDEYVQRVIRECNFENPIVILRRFLRSLAV
jgi:hypothetical protein